ncbi:hypothetical protein K438DRAFT_1770558 [Mycena galopus ATCC 62051]|nr:hypothetical protein K438DRAFT_1770558 [Mycena galopus ATCC 62051]
MTMAAVGLKDILTPELFRFMVECRIPFSKTEPLDFVQVGQDFMSNNFQEKCQERAWPALLFLSRVGLENMPDMMDFLPPATDPDFSLQCLGLQLLLDQAPRALCSSASTDGRYVNSYFDILAQRLVASWLALPAKQRPDSWTNSKGTISLDYWLLMRLWLGAPLVHNGTVKSQELAVAFSEETRSVVEMLTGTRDPNRARRDTIFSDIYAFPRPIIDRFGRYPYRNAIQGLESTDEEKEWIEKTDHFGEAPSDVAKKVKEDIARGEPASSMILCSSANSHDVAAERRKEDDKLLVPSHAILPSLLHYRPATEAQTVGAQPVPGEAALRSEKALPLDADSERPGLRISIPLLQSLRLVEAEHYGQEQAKHRQDAASVEIVGQADRAASAGLCLADE